ncbi:MAG: hypothetical protein EOP06_14235 [Proteobacteria bacterium]|nr:MAG: hypothetical protein EOP06_14235 [Pseudomonadota bacterium]
MGDKVRAVVNLFDNQRFEKFRTVDEGTGQTQVSFAVDGVEVTSEEWIEQQEAAIARDLRRFLPEKYSEDN